MAKKPAEFELDLGDGRDELNLAEFPLSLISKKASDDVDVLVFEDSVYDRENKITVNRKVTISGSADCGLPTAADEEVLLALIQITKQQGFSNKTVHFSRYQLLQILGWEDTGYYYKRVLNALNTWLGVNVKWQNAWRDYSKNSNWGSKGIVLIQDFELKRRDGKDSSSYITWADQLFSSFQSGNLKGLDFGLYRALRNSIAKRMFRFLDKRFYNQGTLAFDLSVFAYEKIGMKRSYALPNVKQQFQPAILELQNVGFLKTLPDKQRYRKVKAGVWEIVFTRGTGDSVQGPLADSPETLPDVEKELVRRGVSRSRAKSLAARFPEDHIRAKLEDFDFRMAREAGDPLRPKNPGGYLAQAIQEDYSPPKGFKSSAELEQERLEREAQAAGRKAARETKAKAEAEKKAAVDSEYQRQEERVRSYLETLPEEDRVRLEAEALASTLLGAQATGRLRQSLIHEHVLNLIQGSSNVA